MDKILITGFSGFVSLHFLKYLESNNIHTDILGIDIILPYFDFKALKNVNCRFEKVDLLNKDMLEEMIYSFKPDYIIHLASYSSVSFSWKSPSLSFKNNMVIFLNLLEMVRDVCPSCRVLSVGSSEEYGNVDKKMIPLKEETPLSPVSPYAVARVSQEHLSKVYSKGFGLDIVMTRSFNHIGPGQKEIFVVSSFVKQMIEMKKGVRKDKKLITGDISIIRDFLDVRDVVDAYYRLLKNGMKGEVYNICSGTGVTLKEIIDIMCEKLDLKIVLEVDEKLIRPDDNKIIIGSNEKLKAATNWAQEITLNDSINDLLKYWDERL
jgi:GDP-4-dehydro-6-deoxy-D-mannose reductase